MSANKETSVGIKLVADLRNYQQGMSKAQKGTKTFSKNVKTSMTDAKGSIMALARGDLSAIPGLFKSAGKSTGILTKGLHGVKAALIATGIGAIIVGLGLAIGAVTQYFKGTEEGQIAFKKVMNKIQVYVGPILSLFGKLGKQIVNAFKNPEEAVKNLWKVIKQNFVNRITGLSDLFIALKDIGVSSFKLISSSIKNIWSDQTESINKAKTDLKGAALDMGKALLKTTTGLEKIPNIFSETAKQIKANKGNVDELNAAEEKLITFKRSTLIANKKLESEIASARLKANDEDRYSAKQRQVAINEAIAKQKQLAANKTEELALESKIANIKASFGDNDIAANDELAQLKFQQYEIIREQDKKLAMIAETQQRINRELTAEIASQQKINEQIAQRQNSTSLKTIETKSKATWEVTAPKSDELDDMTGWKDQQAENLKELTKEWYEFDENAAMIAGSLATTVSNLGQSMVESLGLASTGFEGFVGSMLGTFVELIAGFLAQSIAVAITGAELSGLATGPLAAFSTPLLVAKAVAQTFGAFAAIPSFATGKGVMYGENIVRVGEYAGARMNPELIGRKDQFDTIIGDMFNKRGGMGGTVVNLTGNLDIDMKKIRFYLKEVDNNNNRVR